MIHPGSGWASPHPTWIYLAGLGASPGLLVLKTGSYFRPDPETLFLDHDGFWLGQELWLREWFWSGLLDDRIWLRSWHYFR